MKNILITGGLGFIGSNFIRHIYYKYPEYYIWNFDLMTYAGNTANLIDIEASELNQKNKRYFFVKGDICDVNTVNDLFKKIHFDLVLNFAAESHVDRSLINSAEFIRSNITGVHVLINILRHYDHARFIQISTDEIYGDIPKNKKSDENYPIRPSNPYSASKAAADLLVQSYIRTYNLPAIIVRGSNNFGYYQYPEKIIPLAITNLIQDMPIPIHGLGNQTRTWIHVEDFCEGIDLVMHQAPNASIYNIAGTEKRVIDIIKKISSILKKDFDKIASYVNDRPGQDMRYAPDPSKMLREFNWKPNRIIDDSLIDIVNWYLNNKDWWQKIRDKKEFLDHYEKQSRAEHS